MLSSYTSIVPFRILGMGPVLCTSQTPASNMSFEVPALLRIMRIPLPLDIGPYLEIRVFSLMHRKENVFSITKTGNVKVITKLCFLPVVCMYCDEECESFAF